MLVTIWLCIKYAWQNSVTHFKSTTLKLWNSWIIKFTCLGVLSQMSYGPWHCALYSLSLIQCNLVYDTIPEFMNTNHFQRLVDKNVSQWTLTRKYNFCWTSISQSGFAALHAACQEGYDHVVDMLLQAGANVNQKTKVRWGSISSVLRTLLHTTAATASFIHLLHVP